MDKRIKLYVDRRRPHRPRSRPGRPGQHVLQTCFFAISGCCRSDQAIAPIKTAIAQDLRPAQGAEVVARN